MASFKRCTNDMDIVSYGKMLESGNLMSKVFSPTSFNVIMDILMESLGKDTESLKEINEFYGTSWGESICKNHYDVLMSIMYNYARPDSVVKIFNGVYINEKIPVKEEFKKKISSIADVQNVIPNNKFVDYVNSIVSTKTNGMISNILKPDEITPLMISCYLNVIYFKASWKDSFDSDLTKSKLFTNYAGTTQSVNMMFKKFESIPYYENENIQMIELPFKQSEFRFGVILPKKVGSTSDINVKNNLDKIKFLQGSDVNVHLPKFKYESEFDLIKFLNDNNMKSILLPSLDFSELINAEAYLNIFKQKAVIDVNEIGAEASACTVAVMFLMCAGTTKKVYDFNADHTFQFYICDIKQNLILFSGIYDGSDK